MTIEEELLKSVEECDLTKIRKLLVKLDPRMLENTNIEIMASKIKGSTTAFLILSYRATKKDSSHYDESYGYEISDTNIKKLYEAICGFYKKLLLNG